MFFCNCHDLLHPQVIIVCLSIHHGWWSHSGHLSCVTPQVLVVWIQLPLSVDFPHFSCVMYVSSCSPETRSRANWALNCLWWEWIRGRASHPDCTRSWCPLLPEIGSRPSCDPEWNKQLGNGWHSSLLFYTTPVVSLGHVPWRAGHKVRDTLYRTHVHCRAYTHKGSEKNRSSMCWRGPNWGEKWAEGRTFILVLKPTRSVVKNY